MESGLIFKLFFVYVSLQVGCRLWLWRQGTTMLTSSKRLVSFLLTSAIRQSLVSRMYCTLKVSDLNFTYHTNMQWKQNRMQKQHQKFNKMPRWLGADKMCRVTPQCYEQELCYPTNSIFPNIQLPIFSLQNSNWAQEGVIQLFISLKRESCSDNFGISKPKWK
jgi:hypothetical protein